MSQPPPPPYAPPPGPPGPPGPPARSRTGRTVAIVLAAVAALAGIGVAAFVVADRMLHDDAPAASDTGTSAGATGSPTSSPTGGPTGDDTGGDTATATSGSPGDDLTAPYSPTDDTGDDVHGDVSVADFPGDWDFRLGDVEHHARLTRSVDHSSCGPVEKDAVLSRQRCEHAAQWIFTALGGKVRLTQVFLVFDTERHAKAAQAALGEDDLDLSPDSTFTPALQRQWRSSVYGNIISLTVGTSRARVDEQRLRSLVGYMNTDYRTALLFSF